MLNDSYNFPSSYYFAFNTGRSKTSANLSLRRLYSFGTYLFRDSINSNRIVTLWNHSPVTITEQSSVPSFKTNLYKCYVMKLDHEFDIARPRTGKSICHRCRSVNMPLCC